jgi:thiol-disulfide isomerase/thioredoxin
MKKLITLALLMLSGVAAHAQLPAGSAAPDFTAPDITGRIWNLHQILESGRPVVMDISATWCGPCWSYHNSGALETFYEQHGPEGDARAMVFFIEGDGSTNTQCLYGPSGCNDVTQGNWVANTPYPIIDNANIANAYDIAYFPTVYLICPDKTVTEVGPDNANLLWTQASACAVSIPANWAKVNTFDAGARSLEFCGPQRIAPSFELANFGTADITAATLELRWNGTVIQTKTFDGLVHPLDLAKVTFDSLDVSEPGALSVEISSLNNGNNSEAAYAEIEFTAPAEDYTGQQIELRLRTDVSAKEIFWVVYDEEGNIFDQGGNSALTPQSGGQYANSADVPIGPGTYNNNATLRDTITVPGACFTFLMVDALGDGFKVPGNYNLRTLGAGTNFHSVVGDFGAYDGAAYGQSTSGTEGLAPNVAAVTLAPNPATESIQLTYELARATSVQIEVCNSVGQLVRSEATRQLVSGSQQQQIDLGSLTNGLYFVRIRTADGGTTTQPFVKM